MNSTTLAPVPLTHLLRGWFAILILMVANGTFRELLLKPQIDAAVADVVSAVLGAIIVLVTTRYSFRPLAGHATRELLRVSAIFVVLTVAFEFLFGHYVDGHSWAELLANYEFWNGRLWPFLLVLLALTPFIWGRWAAEVRRAH